jgi:hypothetical protein
MRELGGVSKRALRYVGSEEERDMVEVELSSS